MNIFSEKQYLWDNFLAFYTVLWIIEKSPLAAYVILQESLLFLEADWSKENGIIQAVTWYHHRLAQGKNESELENDFER